MKNFFYAVLAKNGEKYAAYIDKINPHDNAKNLASKHADAVAINFCATKKAAKELAAFWNECHRKNGNHLYLN